MRTPRLPAPTPSWAPAVLAVATMAIYAPSLSNGFTNWDDPKYVVSSPFATRGLAGVPLAFVSAHEDAYYPLTHSVHALAYAAFGDSPLAHHAVEVAIFALAVALLPAALAAFGVPASVGFWTALVWSAHPMRVESVSWIANLKDPLALLGIVLSFALYARGKRAASAVAFSAALLAKSMFFPVAGLFLLLEAKRTGERGIGAVVAARHWLVPAFLLAALGGLLHVIPSEAAGRTRPGGSLVDSIPSAVWVPWWYLARTIELAHPQAVYEFAPPGWSDPRFLAACAAWIAIFAWAFTRRSDARWRWCVGLGAWLLPYLPVTGLVPLVYPLADRYSFVPSIPISFAAVTALAGATRRLPAALPTALLALVVAAQATAGVPRQLEWRDAVTLWEADRSRNPDSWTVHFNLAGAYGAEGRWDDAFEEARVAQALRPRRSMLDWFVLAELAKAGAPPEWAVAVQMRIRESSGDPAALRGVAAELLRSSQPKAARVVVDSVLALGDDAGALYLSALCAAVDGDPAAGLESARRALELDPEHVGARLLQVEMLQELARNEEALAAAKDFEPEDGMSRALLANAKAKALLRLGRIDEALDATELPLDEADRPLVVISRAAALTALGRYEDALESTSGLVIPEHERPLVETIRQAAIDGLMRR